MQIQSPLDVLNGKVVSSWKPSSPPIPPAMPRREPEPLPRRQQPTPTQMRKSVRTMRLHNRRIKWQQSAPQYQLTEERAR